MVPSAAGVWAAVDQTLQVSASPDFGSPGLPLVLVQPLSMVFEPPDRLPTHSPSA